MENFEILMGKDRADKGLFVMGITVTRYLSYTKQILETVGIFVSSIKMNLT